MTIKTPLLLQRSFSFGRYNLLPFTDTNSVICKIIVGGLASLFEGGGICEANDGRSVVRTMGHSPVTACAVPAPS